ncbi:MAG: hypothetical protein ACT4PM_12745 [Gemmatimonadales bacterium]
MAASKRRRLRGLACLTLPAALSTCATLAMTQRGLPLGAVPRAAPPVYRDWHEKTKDCSGLSGDFSALKWYVVPSVSTFLTAGGPQVGLWAGEHGQHRIVIAGNYAEHEMVVRHEILHALLGRSGHPAEYFVERCHLTWDSWTESSATAAGHPE